MPIVLYALQDSFGEAVLERVLYPTHLPLSNESSAMDDPSLAATAQQGLATAAGGVHKSLLGHTYGCVRGWPP